MKFYQNILVFLFFANRNIISWGSSQSTESLSWSTRLYGPIWSKHFSPTFLQEHHPNLFSMRFSKDRFPIITRKLIIGLYELPLTINEHFNHVVVRLVDREQNFIENYLGIEWNNWSNAAQEITVSELPLHYIFGFDLPGQSNSTFLTMDYWGSHHEDFILAPIEYFSCVFVCADVTCWIFFVSVSSMCFNESLESLEILKLFGVWDSQPIQSIGRRKYLSYIKSIR